MRKAQREIKIRMKTNGILDLGELVVHSLVGVVYPKLLDFKLCARAVGDNGPYLDPTKNP
jgi:hypothetical protein